MDDAGQDSPRPDPPPATTPPPQPRPAAPVVVRYGHPGPPPLRPLPPPPPFSPVEPVAPVSEAVRDIPTAIRPMVGRSMDLLFRSDSGLRRPSLYVGFMALVTVAPLVALLGLQALSGVPLFDPFAPPTPVDGWIALAALPALLGYLVASVESRTLATAVVAGRLEGRPLGLAQSVAIARKRFWRMFLVQLAVGLLTLIIATIVTVVVDVALFEVGPIELIDIGISLVAGVVIAIPFVYAPAGIVLGEVGVMEALGRSIRLVRLRPRLGLVLALFAAAPQLLVGIGLGAALDILIRLAGGVDALERFPMPLVIPVAAALSFAFGTLILLAEAIAASPAVHAFASLTHYTRGLEIGRREPVDLRRAWAPWLTPGLAIGAGVALLALVGGVLALE